MTKLATQSATCQASVELFFFFFFFLRTYIYVYKSIFPHKISKKKKNKNALIYNNYPLLLYIKIAPFEATFLNSHAPSVSPQTFQETLQGKKFLKNEQAKSPVRPLAAAFHPS